LSKLIEAAERREEINIARAGKPVVTLVALQNQSPSRKAGSMKGLFEVPESFFDPLPEDILHAFEGKAYIRCPIRTLTFGGSSTHLPCHNGRIR